MTYIVEYNTSLGHERAKREHQLSTRNLWDYDWLIKGIFNFKSSMDLINEMNISGFSYEFSI